MIEVPVPFRIEIADDLLQDLHNRLVNVRLPKDPPADAEYGVRPATIHRLVEYWRTVYDWRLWEARLNQYPQYTMTIDGLRIHFLHVVSGRPNAVPLILSHGWPGTVAEFLDVIGPLTDPERYGLGPSITFDLVIPSLPGFGWSDPPTETGWGPRRIGRAWAKLMRELGYRRYGAAGNDWGSHISPEVGLAAPDEVIGVHVTQLFSLPAGEWISYPPSVEPSEVSELTSPDLKALAELRDLQRSAGAYSHVHAQRPDTLAYALSDSPVGLLAWNSQVMGGLSDDALLTHVSIHWLTGTAGSALRIYAEHARQEPAERPTEVPLGLAQFPHDVRAIRRYADRDHAKIVSWTVHPDGGHYAAHQTPEVLVDDIRDFYLRLLDQRDSVK